MSTTLRTADAFWQHATTKQLSAKLSQFSADQHFLVACSGGRDSLFLLYALIQLAGAARIHVVTVNHGLHPDAAKWCAHVQACCQSWGVDCETKTVTIAAGNIEQQARLARYQAFSDVIAQLDQPAILVLGHHLQDQAETVLMRLFRGSGLRGLGAMHERDTRFGMMLWRPLLDISRQYIDDMTTDLALDFIEDDANANPQYLRVFLRQQLIPKLNKRLPRWMEATGRSAQLLTDAQSIVDEVIAADQAACCPSKEMLKISALRALPLPRQRLLVAQWLQGAHHYSPSFEIINQVLSLMQSQADAQPKLYWHDCHVQRHADLLYRLAAAQPNAQMMVFQLALGDTVDLPSGIWQVTASEPGFDFDLLLQPLSFCPRQGGERMQLSANQPRRALKKIMQEAKLMVWQREQSHVIFAAEQLLCVLTPMQIWYESTLFQAKSGWVFVKK